MLWLREDPQERVLWVRSLDDVVVCPLRAYFSSSQARSSVPYSEEGMRFQKRILEGLRGVLRGRRLYLDPGIRGLRTGGEGLKVCARVRGHDVAVCGRPDAVALYDEPLTALVIEAAASDLYPFLKVAAPRLSFYAQGVHDFFGLPVSVLVTTPERWAFIRVSDCLDHYLDKLLRFSQDFEDTKRATLRLFERGTKGGYGSLPCGSCGYSRVCPVSKGLG